MPVGGRQGGRAEQALEGWGDARVLVGSGLGVEEEGPCQSSVPGPMCLSGWGCQLAFPLAGVWGRGRAGVPWHPARLDKEVPLGP